MNGQLIIDPPPAQQVDRTPHRPKLVLHCGAKSVDMEQVCRVSTPASTASWQPISHAHLANSVQTTLSANNLSIGTQAHSLSHDGMRYFGLMEVHSRYAESTDYCWVLGIRNSHDKKFPAGIVAGASVFVCDNLSFSGEVKFARKHTRFINRDLPQLVERAVGRLVDKWHDQDRRIAAYREREIEDRDAHDLVVRATDVGVCTNQLVPTVLREWRSPRHLQFRERNVWSLFNSFTEALKGTSLGELPKRTEALHGLLDVHVGFAQP